MTHGNDRHRQMDRGFNRSMARDGDGDEPGAERPMVASRDRGKDARTLSAPPGKVLLTQLSIRESARGRRYLSGWLGKAAVVGFEGEPDKFGNQTWAIYVSTPTPRPDGQRPPAGGGRDDDRG